VTVGKEKNSLTCAVASDLPPIPDAFLKVRDKLLGLTTAHFNLKGQE
jgi:hypothetical protein